MDPKTRTVHYVHVFSMGPMIIVRLPFPQPKWRDVLKAFTGMMREHGLKQKDITSLEGVVPHPGDGWKQEDIETVTKMDAAYEGGEQFAGFTLYDWRDGKFVLARKALK